VISRVTIDLLIQQGRKTAPDSRCDAVIVTSQSTARGWYAGGREGVRQWRDTGQAPPDLAAMVPEGASGGGSAATSAQAQALRAPDGTETLASLEAGLGPGQPLDGATASRMSGALGLDVSSARLHTGPVPPRRPPSTARSPPRLAATS
jgi:hypothetical protein